MVQYLSLVLAVNLVMEKNTIYVHRIMMIIQLQVLTVYQD